MKISKGDKIFTASLFISSAGGESFEAGITFTLHTPWSNFFILAVVSGSFLILVVPGKFRYYYTLSLILFIILVTSIPAVFQFFSPLANSPPGPVSSIREVMTSTNWVFKGYLGELRFTLDPLSDFFILVTNFHGAHRPALFKRLS